MQVNNSVLKMIVTGILALGIIAAPIYFAYDMFFGKDVTTLGPNPALYGPKVQKASSILSGEASSKMSFKQADVSFLDTPLYKSFVDPPIDVPLSESRGRPDPFVPYYAAP
jgi:hypothetical protein